MLIQLGTVQKNPSFSAILAVAPCFFGNCLSTFYWAASEVISDDLIYNYVIMIQYP